ncbi:MULTISPECIES: S26 family signal peptidase [unclassified Sphingomonas]|uniref:S26 family signal peptidase n=1 Tax=unclassified Sphingomonas TaxID=196159 RepID=UPI002150894A|nr:MULTISPECIES: S26 family signal peptidase [unclassified Sphingomonas]MCR5869499.1 S26 family signal peptidase [Sphingomonas sp. J344]UUX98776.1 S26 family signal peptidase [Sphingomonas sp. J315]
MRKADPGRPNGPLFAWGDALRATRALRRRHARIAGLALVAALPCIATLVVAPPPLLVWNASSSMPIGLYRVAPGRAAELGELMIAWPPEHARALAARRHYLPANVPLVKRVAAMPGDDVCALGRRLFVNGILRATRLVVDRAGRSLPRWQACVRLRDGQRLLLADAPDSFDGRYFGVSAPGDIIGRATPLWTRSEAREP